MAANDSLFSGIILLALMPAMFFAYREPGRRDLMFWLTGLVALSGPLLWLGVEWIKQGWETSFSTTLMFIVGTTLLLFLGLTSISKHATRLAVLVFPYLFLMTALALVWQTVPGKPLRPNVPTLDLGVHIVVSIVTFGILTLAAAASLGAFLKERALKRKKSSGISAMMPSVADGEALVFKLLVAGEVVMALGVATGVATKLHSRGIWLELDHKTVLSLASFAVIGGLLAAHYLAGVRGRLLTRFVLLGFALLFLAYPGVKFVTDIIIGSSGG